jgi:mono/diheme cytochrome c family protein
MGQLARSACYLPVLLCALTLQAAAATAQEQTNSAAIPADSPRAIKPPLVSLAAFQNEVEAALQPATPPAENALDAAAVSAGQAAFASACTTCHDAERSLSKRKSFAGWLATVRRMAGKDGAEIRSSDVAPIATYLASVAGATGAAGGAGDGSTDDGSGWSFGTTISTLHRSASDEYPVEFPGFFADVWLSASYQSTGPWRASVTACTSCHSGTGFTFELVEGSATIDLRHLFHGCRCEDGREMLLKAGRFVTPFGAFAAMSHPGIYRTVTNPLMFNMGRRVFVPDSSPPLQPVLPMPFSDEGIDFIFRTPVTEELTFTLDLYAINGLQGAAPNVFLRSRAYYDNNEEPSLGARATIGADYFRLGASVLGGNLQDQGLEKAYYTLAGADATAQITDRLRFYFEYAMRRHDSIFVPETEEHTFGVVTELEYQFLEHPNIGLLVRYDTLQHRNQAFSDAKLERVTWGFNFGLPGGSLLMINHEWWKPERGDDADVLAVRWVVSL